MKAIENIDDIKTFVDSFYTKVRKDELLAPVFESRIRDWQPHLDTMYKFWNAVLFQARDYNGNPFAHHVSLPVDQHHFDRWLKLFFETLDEQFGGQVAETAKFRATTIARTFYNRMKGISMYR